MDARWYVIHVYSGFERKVAQSIEEQARQGGMSDRIQQVMVPMEEVVEVRRGQKVNAERKFFPGYVLVKMEMSDETWHLVKNTPKVTGFLGADNKPIPRTIKLGGQQNGYWVVLEGLQKGEQVVVDGFQKLRGGAPVQTVPWTPPGAPAPAAAGPASAASGAQAPASSASSAAR